MSDTTMWRAAICVAIASVVAAGCEAAPAGSGDASSATVAPDGGVRDPQPVAAGGGVTEDGVAACVPACDSAECGDDGCGGICGECAEDYDCAAGLCECVPMCEGAECGDDGCGGTCGECAEGDACVSGLCECVPSCGGAECGDDGCGGTCGACSGAESCVDGECGIECASKSDCPKTSCSCSASGGGWSAQCSVTITNQCKGGMCSLKSKSYCLSSCNADCHP